MPASHPPWAHPCPCPCRPCLFLPSRPSGPPSRCLASSPCSSCPRCRSARRSPACVAVPSCQLGFVQVSKLSSQKVHGLERPPPSTDAAAALSFWSRHRGADRNGRGGMCLLSSPCSCSCSHTVYRTKVHDALLALCVTLLILLRITSASTDAGDDCALL